LTAGLRAEACRMPPRTTCSIPTLWTKPREWIYSLYLYLADVSLRTLCREVVSSFSKYCRFKFER
jgi:hypothetical protein